MGWPAVAHLHVRPRHVRHAFQTLDTDCPVADRYGCGANSLRFVAAPLDSKRFRSGGFTSALRRLRRCCLSCSAVRALVTIVPLALVARSESSSLASFEDVRSHDHVHRPHYQRILSVLFSGIVNQGSKDMTAWPNKPPKPNAVGACRFAVAVRVASRRCLSFHFLHEFL
jgi:hypothetical protein